MTRSRATASGLTPDDCAEIAARLARDGLVDFLNVSVGTSGIGMVRPMYAPHLLGVRATAIVKQAVPDVPVFAVHRILTPDEAEGILEDGAADAVTMVRALIADPEWANKARADRAGEIRACTGCNQGCYGNLTQGYPINCVTNPSVGREATLGQRHADAGRDAQARRRRGRRAGGARSGVGRRRARSRRDLARTRDRARRQDPARGRCCPDAASSPRSRTGGPASARDAVSTCGSASTPTATRCSRSRPTQ